MTKESKDGTLYLIVPAKNEDGPRQTQDETVENEGLQDWARDSWRAFTGEGYFAFTTHSSGSFSRIGASEPALFGRSGFSEERTAKVA